MCVFDTPPSQAGVWPSVGDGDASAQPNASSTSCTERVSVTRVWLMCRRGAAPRRTPRIPRARSESPAAAGTRGRTCRCPASTGSAAGRRRNQETGRRAACSGCSARPDGCPPGVSWRNVSARRIGEELGDEAGLLFGRKRPQRVHEVRGESRIVRCAAADPLVGDARRSSPPSRTSVSPVGRPVAALAFDA